MRPYHYTIEILAFLSYSSPLSQHSWSIQKGTNVFLFCWLHAGVAQCFLCAGDFQLQQTAIPSTVFHTQLTVPLPLLSRKWSYAYIVKWNYDSRAQNKSRQHAPTSSSVSGSIFRFRRCSLYRMPVRSFLCSFVFIFCFFPLPLVFSRKHPPVHISGLDCRPWAKVAASSTCFIPSVVCR